MSNKYKVPVSEILFSFFSPLNPQLNLLLQCYYDYFSFYPICLIRHDKPLVFQLRFNECYRLIGQHLKDLFSMKLEEQFSYLWVIMWLTFFILINQFFQLDYRMKLLYLSHLTNCIHLLHFNLFGSPLLFVEIMHFYLNSYFILSAFIKLSFYDSFDFPWASFLF